MADTRFQQAICRLIAANRDLYQGEPAQLRRDLAVNNLIFHPGSIRGAYPQIPR